MARKPSYADALKVLGRDDSAVLDLAERLVEGGLDAAGVPDLFGLRGEIVAKGRGLLTTIRERITGVSRWDRTQRVDAAHQILATMSLLEALEEVLDEVGPAEQGLTDEVDPAEQGLTDEVLDHLTQQILEGSGIDIAKASALGGWSFTLTNGLLVSGKSLALHLVGSPADLGEMIQEKAEQRYLESYRQLAADVPEFGVWVNLAEHEHTRVELATGLTELEGLLTRLSPATKARQHVRELHTLYRGALWRPVLSGDDAPDHLTLPTLEDSYVNPRARAHSAHKSCRPASEDWWAEETTPHDDVQTLLARCLTQVWCATLPIVILGHPGAGKSKLTEMLAARLPADDFLAVRVELRGVSADAPIRKQIEEAVSGQVHRDVAWRDLVESAEGAQPVVILDGFDELLQATGVNRSDYLEQVQQFQQDQATLGQPVAVIVTSRTVVADRLRFPDGCALIRLEPFNEPQIARMLDTWASANAGALAARGLRPLSLDTALRYRELAEQPLLLLMLLLYDADGNALEAAGDALSRSELYERMLTMFARREVTKHHPNLPERDMDTAVGRELNRLEVAAMAMFSRGRQSVAAEELERDLAALFPEPTDQPGDTGLHGAVSEAHQVLGRFFFVHESRAQLDGRNAGVYEFLHATFAEFLVARMVTAALGELADDRRHAARRRFAAPLDDGLLYAITSFAALATRASVVDFTTELLRQRFDETPDAREEYRELLLTLFHEAPYPAPARSFTGYQPWRADILTRQASYTANLVTLLVCVCEELDLVELFPDTDAPWRAWRRMANQWRSMSNEAWHGLVDTVRSRHLEFWDGAGNSRIERERGDPVNVGECVGFEISEDLTKGAAIRNPYDITMPFDGPTSKLLRSAALRDNGTAARMFLLLGPYFRHVSTDLLTWYSDRDDPGAAWNELHDILELRLAPPLHDRMSRMQRYKRLLESRHLGRLELLVLRQAVDDLEASGTRSSANGPILLVLTRIILEHLKNLESIVTGPKLSRVHVEPVLESLRRHINVPDHVAKLLDEHERLGAGEPANTGDRGAHALFQLPESDSGYVRDRFASLSDRDQEDPDSTDQTDSDDQKEPRPSAHRRQQKRRHGDLGTSGGSG
ncbi:hypothetical protein F4561_002249 [Lipingzhangella halophila]|uniref:AAA+ ATPase domain-containing protein n=1 Tax=Lipingzhangella halophila TaxID=1783352 RepID=A0A7W7RGA5_9ACTN|nr:ATP-binding protein [Lipingzhangella halophila]MBB4931429.1 hypothetical protein [Lipingzhangella halophila]